MAVQRKEQAASGQEVRGDVGLLEGHFIRPTGPRNPSLIRDPRRWSQFQWAYAKAKFRCIHGQFSYKFFLKKGKPRPKLDRRKIGPLAQMMYEQMYTAFAKGDVDSLKGNCLEGVVASLRSKIDYRPSNERVHWTLHRYIGWPRIVSMRVGRLPLDDSAIIQAVVRITSMQSLQRMVKAKGSEFDKAIEEKKGEPKKMMEYVVMQKRMIKGKEELWKLWGLTEETKPEDVLGEDIVAPSQAVVK